MLIDSFDWLKRLGMVFRLTEHIPFYAFEILGGSLFGRVNIYFSRICPLQLNPSTLNRWQRCGFLWVKTWKISGAMAGISDVTLYLENHSHQAHKPVSAPCKSPTKHIHTLYTPEKPLGRAFGLQAARCWRDVRISVVAAQANAWRRLLAPLRLH